MTIGIGLVAYNNNPEDLIKLSKSLSNCKLIYKVVVDNSPSENLKKIFEEYNWTYIFNNNNLGFGSSHNIIIKKFSSKAKYHVVINPDIYFDFDIMSTLAKFMEETPDCGNVMPKILYPNTDNQRIAKLLPSPYGWFLRRFAKNTNLLNIYNYKFELHQFDENDVYKSPYLSGCFMFLRVDSLNKVGLFDENIFMYGEDADLTRRLWISKNYPYYFGKAFVYHQFAKGSHRSFKLLVTAIKSTIYYFNKWGWFDKNRKIINRECLDQVV
ncbi:MAG: glycosyltransferase [Vicingaceae bacterium]